MRTLLATIVLGIAVSHVHTAAQSSSVSVRKEQTKVLVHVTQGPENPAARRAAFLVAKTASLAGVHRLNKPLRDGLCLPRV